MIRFACSHCDKALRAPDTSSGRQVKCPACGRLTALPPAPAELPLPEEEPGDIRAGVPPSRPSGDAQRPRRKPADRDADSGEQRPPRRKRRRVRKDRDDGKGFSLVDAIPVDYNLQIWMGAGGGILLNIIAVAFQRSAGQDLSLVGLLLGSLGLLFWIWGCAAYAKNKGYPELVGLLGLIGCIGLGVLVFLPDRSRG